MAIVLHLVEYPVAAFERHSVIGLAAVSFRRLGQDRQISHFVQVEVGDVLVEIGARGSLYAKTAAAQRDFVEIEGDDLALRQHPLDPRGEDHFLQLAGDRIFVADEDVLGDLLGDGRPAHGALARADLADIVEHGIGKAGRIDAAMAPEGFVLGGGVGIDQLRRQVLVIKLDPPLTLVTVDDLAIDAAHHRWQVRLIV